MLHLMEKLCRCNAEYENKIILQKVQNRDELYIGMAEKTERGLLVER